MSMKKALAGAILAGGAMFAPFAKGDAKTNDSNGVSNTQEAGKADKITIPSWIPTTADGKFDEKKAQEQSEMLWAKHGQDIQQYADDVKSGMSEEIAFTKFANRLANGDKEKEKEILSLHNAIKTTQEIRKGKMKVIDGHSPLLTWGNIATAIVLAMVFGSKKHPFISFGVSLGVLGLVDMTMTDLMKKANMDTIDARRCFVAVQKAMYDSYKQQDTSNKWTYTDMQTTKQMIEMAQKTRIPGK